MMTTDYSKAHTVEQARYQALAKGWPVLYLALSADIFAVAVVHWSMAPGGRAASCPPFSFRRR